MGVLVGVDVLVGVTVCVGVDVGVGVFVEVGVEVGVGVSTDVGVGVGVGVQFSGFNLGKWRIVDFNSDTCLFVTALGQTANNSWTFFGHPFEFVIHSVTKTS